MVRKQKLSLRDIKRRRQVAVSSHNVHIKKKNVHKRKLYIFVNRCELGV